MSQQQPTKNQLKGYALKNCVDFFEGRLTQEALLDKLNRAKVLWGKAQE